MRELIDLTGQTFGRWTVMRRAESPTGRTMWLCKCSCGTERAVFAADLKSQKSKSCGCLRNELSSERAKARKIFYRTAGKRLYFVG